MSYFAWPVGCKGTSTGECFSGGSSHLFSTLSCPFTTCHTSLGRIMSMSTRMGAALSSSFRHYTTITTIHTTYVYTLRQLSMNDVTLPCLFLIFILSSRRIVQRPMCGCSSFGFGCFLILFVRYYTFKLLNHRSKESRLGN